MVIDLHNTQKMILTMMMMMVNIMMKIKIAITRPIFKVQILYVIRSK